MKVKNILIITLINLFMAIGAMAQPPTVDNFANTSASTSNIEAPFDNFADAFTLTSDIRLTVESSTAGATKEMGEPDHAGNVGGRSVWFKWTAPMTRNVLVTTNRSGNNLDTLLHVYSGTSLNNLESLYYNNNIDASTNRRSSVVLNAVINNTYYIAIDGYNDGVNPPAEGMFKLDILPYFMQQGADFDTDGMTDLSVFRPATGDWHVNGTTRSFTEHWGQNGDIPVIFSRSSVPAITVFRPTDGMWYYHTLSNNDLYIPWGTNGDIPLADDFGGILPNPTVFRPSTGTWYIYGFGNNPHRYYQFGQQGDIPVAGQYSPDAVADIAVFRPANGTWYFTLRASTNPVNDNFRAVKFGQAGDKPVPADYDGDGLLDIAIYRPTTGTWWVQNTSNGLVSAFRWGIAEDIPTTGDFDGDGKYDRAVFRPSNATWYIYRSGDGQIQIQQFGQTGDIPITSNRAF